MWKMDWLAIPSSVNKLDRFLEAGKAWGYINIHK
jgi:hypothetical protein